MAPRPFNHERTATWLKEIMIETLNIPDVGHEDIKIKYSDRHNEYVIIRYKKIEIELYDKLINEKKKSNKDTFSIHITLYMDLPYKHRALGCGVYDVERDTIKMWNKNALELLQQPIDKRPKEHIVSILPNKIKEVITAYEKDLYNFIHECSFCCK